MFSAILAFFTGGSTKLWLIIGIVATAAAFILLGPKFSEIGAFLGFETKASLKTELKQEQANNVVLKEADKTNQQTNEILQGHIENIQVATEAKAANDVKTTKTVTKILKDTGDKVAAVQADTVTPPDVKEVEIAKLHMASIWTAYCSLNTDAPECPATAPTAEPATT